MPLLIRQRIDHNARRGGALSPPSVRSQTGAGTRPRPYDIAGGAIRAATAWALLVLAVIGCGAPANAPEAAAPAPPVIGEVSLISPQELRAAIEAEKGNVVVMNFWATWCPPCVNEMPELAKFWRDFDGKGVRFFSVSADYAATKDSVVIPFMNSYEIPFPVRIMAVDNPDELTSVLKLDWDGALPATFIYDREGEMVWHTIGGEMTRDSLAERIKPLLEGTAGQ